jgi:hypothetical protein
LNFGSSEGGFKEFRLRSVCGPVSSFRETFGSFYQGACGRKQRIPRFAEAEGMSFELPVESSTEVPMGMAVILFSKHDVMAEFP